MLDQLRKKQKIVIYIIAFVFIVGMAIMGITGIFEEPRDIVGVIDGVKVTYAMFQEELQKNLENYRQQNPDAEMNKDLVNQMSDQTWQRMVQRIVLGKQIKKFGIKITDEDILKEMENNPPQDVLQIPALHTNGRFDRKKYLNALKQETQFFVALDNYFREYLPFTRLMEKVKADAKITLDSLKAEYLKENDEMYGKLIFFDYNKLPNPEVTDAEIKAEYDKTKKTDKDINKGKSSTIKFITFEVKPSDADFNQMKPTIDMIYSDILKGSDFGQLAKDESDDPGSASQFGSLGVFGKGQMVPEFENVAFSLKPGEISKPFKSPFGWHIVRVDSAGFEIGQPKVKASHILKKVEASYETKDHFNNEAEKAAKLIKKLGIEKAAKELKKEAIDSESLYNDSEFIPGIGKHDELLKFAKRKGVGAVSSVEKDRRGNLVVAQIVSKTKDPFVPLDKVKMKIKYELEKQKRVESMKKYALDFAKENKSEDILSSASADTVVKIITLQNFKKTTAIPEVGIVKEINAEALKMNTGQTSEVIDTKDGQFIIICENRIKADMNSFLKNPDEQKKFRTRMEEQAWNRWYDMIMKKAKITDRRQEYSF